MWKKLELRPTPPPSTLLSWNKSGQIKFDPAGVSRMVGVAFAKGDKVNIYVDPENLVVAVVGAQEGGRTLGQDGRRLKLTASTIFRDLDKEPFTGSVRQVFHAEIDGQHGFKFNLPMEGEELLEILKPKKINA